MRGGGKSFSVLHNPPSTKNRQISGGRTKANNLFLCMDHGMRQSAVQGIGGIVGNNYAVRLKRSKTGRNDPRRGMAGRIDLGALYIV